MKLRVMNNVRDRLLVKMTPTAAWALLGFGLILIVS